MPMRRTACKGKTSVKETEVNLKGDKINIFLQWNLHVSRLLLERTILCKLNYCYGNSLQ